ncbi:PadR family transcriptional regulator [Iamia majanohamensis]|uniref:PadR family transcriptional regulator n=1 Tax=Iamia majanohamensis TaxID=467976 RepID=A0AAE9Y490_9ACTN|nr:PadR family transcriptional regulator [Iamia majanohamensis]WCO65760.1 PadR family transcriptional regulator [Iamia majanohamensis]
MRQPTFQILVALAHEERHGYGIIRRVATLTEGQVRLGPGTLYGALDRLVGEGAVVATRTEVVSGRERRYYRLTDSGRETLLAEVERRSAMLDAAREALDLPPGTATT